MTHPPPLQTIPLHVLAIQNDAAQSDMLDRWLVSAGYTATKALDGAAAVRAIFERAPDVIVMDINLPDRDGYELARTLCYLLRVRPVLVALAIAADDDGRSRAEGFDLHLKKPADLDRLAQTLKSLDQKRSLAAKQPRPEAEAERRGARRMPVQGQVRVSCRRGTLDFGANLAVDVLDVSEDGARLRLRTSVEKGLEVMVGIEGRSHLRPVRRGGKIAWCRAEDEGCFQAGIRFDRPLEFADVFKLT